MRVGDKYRFKPTAWTAFSAGEKAHADIGAARSVVGTVAEINLAHGWFRLHYELPNGVTGNECFKLEDEQELKKI